MQCSTDVFEYHQEVFKLECIFFCGFDVEDGHTLKTCPAPWRRVNHQEGFDRNNAGQYIAAGYGAFTKAMDKSQLPNM
jgi:hypothetical protein